MPILSQIIIYPVKSLSGISVVSAELTDRGLKYDRRWMLVNEENRFLSQRDLPLMALVKVEVIRTGLRFSYPGSAHNLLVAFKPAHSETVEASVFDDLCTVQFCNSAADTWFTAVLGTYCRLVYMPDSSRREISEKYTSTHELNSLSDSMPVLLASRASLDLLNEKLDEAIPMNRFRPNLISTGGLAFEEDDYKAVNIAGLNLMVSKPCARCMMTTIDQQTGVSSREPLRTLGTFRKAGRKVLFGIYLKTGGGGSLTCGDQLYPLFRV